MNKIESLERQLAEAREQVAAVSVQVKRQTT